MFIDLDCDLCRLSKTRTKVVAPSGDLMSPVIFVGEAPGEKEDRSGRPFVGRAGKMLDRLLEEEGLPRDRIMITNTVKCRPPRNRRPRLDEVASCRPYLEDELRGKQLIVCLGRTACQGLLNNKVTMKDCANQVFAIAVGRERIDLVPTYHPSAALRNLEAREGLRRTVRLVRERFPYL
ncbi:MAG TPA: uracil-DNA glycosylase [Methanomassiliicoccales archaeon]|nr:uracil-DNA glycosylase [Methanomassiliicoccales archaeon]